MTKVPIGYLKQEVKRPIPLSRLYVEPEDYGIAGAQWRSRTTTLPAVSPSRTSPSTSSAWRSAATPWRLLQKLVASGHHFILVDAPAETLLELSDSVKGKDVLLFNVRAEDEELRQEECRANVLHTAPDRYMLADALAQYLVWKRWQRWFVVKGVFPEDLAYLEAIRRAAKRFGGTIVEEREYKETARRAALRQRRATGPAADAGIYPRRARPMTSWWSPTKAKCSARIYPSAPMTRALWPELPGSTPMSWHPAHEQWGATQMQNRFQRLANRFMWPVDYQAWIAVRAIGEGTTRAATAEFAPVNALIRSKDLSLAAFKGQKVTFSPWDGQLRQPIIVTGPDLPVSISPQEGFLHEKAEVDTLGVDEPETKCKFK